MCGAVKKEKSAFRGVNKPQHLRHPPMELKLSVLHRCNELVEDEQSVSGEIVYSCARIYTWQRKYLQKEALALMTPADDPRGELVPGSPSSPEKMRVRYNKMRKFNTQ